MDEFKERIYDLLESQEWQDCTWNSDDSKVRILWNSNSWTDFYREN